MNGLSEFYKTKDRIKKYSRFYMDGDVYVMEIFDIKLKSIDYLISPHTAAKYGPYILRASQMICSSASYYNFGFIILFVYYIKFYI